MKNLVFAALNFGGAILILVGVFIFINSLAGRSFSFGAVKLPNDSEFGFVLIAAGLIMFSLSAIFRKIARK